MVQFEPVTSRVISTLTLVGVRPSMDPQSSILNLQILLGDIDNIDEDLSQEPDHQNNDGDFRSLESDHQDDDGVLSLEPSQQNNFIENLLSRGYFSRIPLPPTTILVLKEGLGGLPPRIKQVYQGISRYIIVYQGMSRQRWKKRQIRQIYLCYFFLAGANFWHMHAARAI